MDNKTSKTIRTIDQLSEIWKPTMSLRYLHTKTAVYGEFQLQQLWVNGAGKTEWRKVEVVTQN